MLSPGMLVRGLAVAAFASAPVAALGTTPTPNIATGDAIASGPGVGADNTGGNVSIDNGHIVDSPPFLVPVAPTASPKALSVPAKPVNPAADALARAHKLVDDAKAHAQALIDAARAKAEAAVEQAHQQADDAQARAQAHSDAAHQRSADASAQAHS